MEAVTDGPVFPVEFLGDWCCIACRGNGTVSVEDDLRAYIADCEECCGTGWVSKADFESYEAFTWPR